ncbi:YitT family protein [uncultured Bilophila sp.]|uniref:YitT family protein n=1 Tax=uncultured Bilophila sp. TaxID=529385 RepID=UPI00280C2ED6|nr:YitT family protein [uncultured Bilophila sp.]
MGLMNGNVLRNPRLSLRREWHTLLAATIGTLLTCFAVVALTVPYQFAGGGVLGLALISNYAWGISPVWVLSVGNAALLLWGWKALSFRFAIWTLYVTALTSVAIPVFELFRYPVIGNEILAALLAGAVGGLGFGMLFRVGASSGGTDVIVMVARKRWGVNVGAMSFYINVIILFASFVVVDIEKILMGGLLLYVETVVIDKVLKSFDRRSQVLIISKRTQDIAAFILEELDRSATIIPAKGAYSDQPQDMLLVVLTRRQTVDLRQYIAEADPEAFLIFSDVTEVVGLGFKNWE